MGTGKIYSLSVLRMVMGWAIVASGLSSGKAIGSSPVLIPACIDQDGKIVGGTDSDSCKNLLPKCSVILADYRNGVAKNLSLKVFGYSFGKDINTKDTTAKTLVAKDMPFPFCDILGGNIKLTLGSITPSLAFRQRNSSSTRANGGKTPLGADCGPVGSLDIFSSISNREVYLNMNSDRWKHLSATLYGIYNWVLRAKFYEFFKDLKITDLDAKLSDPLFAEIKSKFLDAQEKRKTYFRKLPPPTKEVCKSSKDINLLDRCMKKPGTVEFGQNEPGIRACMLAQLGLILDQTSLQSLIEYQIAKNAETHFQNILRDYFRFPISDLWVKLLRAAQSGSKNRDCLGFDGNRICSAEVASGVAGDGRYWNNEDSVNVWTDETTSDWNVRPVGEKYIGFDLRDLTTAFGNPGDRPQNHNVTESSGIFAIIEAIARKIVCGQVDKYADSPQCASNEITNTVTEIGGEPIEWISK